MWPPRSTSGSWIARGVRHKRREIWVPWPLCLPDHGVATAGRSCRECAEKGVRNFFPSSCRQTSFYAAHPMARHRVHAQRSGHLRTEAKLVLVLLAGRPVGQCAFFSRSEALPRNAWIDLRLCLNTVFYDVSRQSPETRRKRGNPMFKGNISL